MRKKHRIASGGYIQILAMLRTRGMTAMEVADEIDFLPAATRGILFRFMALKVIHIEAWRPKPGRASVAVYRFGEGENAPYPTGKLPDWLRSSYRRKPRQEVIATASLVKELVGGQSSVSELVEATGLCRHTVYSMVKRARKENMARICRWDRTPGVPGAPTPIWTIGSAANASRPKAKSDVECARTWRENKAANDASRALLALGMRAA